MALDWALSVTRLVVAVVAEAESGALLDYAERTFVGRVKSC